MSAVASLAPRETGIWQPRQPDKAPADAVGWRPRHRTQAHPPRPAQSRYRAENVLQGSPTDFTSGPAADFERSGQSHNAIFQRPPSGSFRPSFIDGVVSPGGELFSRRAGVLPNLLGWRRRSAGGCVLVDVEQVGEMLLGGAHIGEHALHAGPSLGAVVVEQHGFFDAGEFVEQFAYRQV